MNHNQNNIVIFSISMKFLLVSRSCFKSVMQIATIRTLLGREKSQKSKRSNNENEERKK